MPAPQTVLRQLAQYLGEQRLAEAADTDLLARFDADHDEAAFAVLVRRHGPRVLGVCRRVLGQSQDAEDAFQASFLILARQGTSLRKPRSLGAWLHGVAYRVASKARVAAARRRKHERQAGLQRPIARDEEPGEALGLLDAELARLPERFREPLILCHLDGLTQAEAASRLVLPPRTLKARLERGRALLRQALERRGVRPDALAGLLAPADAIPGALADRAVFYAMRAATQGEIPASVLSLASGTVGSSVLPRACVVLLALLALGGLALGIGFVPPSVEVRKAAPPARPVDEQRPLVDHHDDPLPEGALARLGTVRLRHGGLIGHAVLSRDGKMLVTMGNDRVIRLWDARTGKPIRQIVCRDQLGCMALSADGKRLAYNDGWTMEVVATQTGDRLTGWQVAEGKEQLTRVDYTSLAFSPDGKSIAGSAKLHTRVWQLSDGKPLHAFSTPDDYYPVHSLSFSADGKRLGTGGKSPGVWDLTTGKAVARFGGHKSRVYCAALSPDGKTLAAGYDDGLIHLWNTATGKAAHVLTGHKGHSHVTSLAFVGDGKTLFSVGRGDASLRAWDVEAGKQTHVVPIQVYDGMSVTVSRDGTTLAAAGDNGIARVWHAKPRDKGGPGWDEVAASGAHQEPVTAVSFSPDGKTLASGGSRGPARLWDVESSKEIARCGGSDEGIYTLAFAPDGKSLVVSNRDNQLRWCHPRTGKVERARRWIADSYPMAIGSRDGKTLVAGFSSMQVQVAQVHPPEKEKILDGHTKWVSRLALSADGGTLATSSRSEPAVYLWNVATGRLARKIGNSHFSWTMALSPDGKLLASADGALAQVWERDTGRQRTQLPEHPTRITALAFSHDGRWLASACDDRVIRLWEAATWRQAGQFRGHVAEIQALTFSPDAKMLASSGSDTTVLVWDATDRFAKGNKQPLTAQRLDALWDELGETPETARRALWALARSPKESVPFLRDRLVTKKADAGRIDKLIAELDDDDQDVRAGATRQLQALGRAAAPAMRAALAKTDSGEVKLRLRLCLNLLDSESAKLRRLRGLAALEYAGTPEARRALEAVQKE